MLRILISDQAQADLENIWFYIAKDNIPAADQLNQRIHESFKSLSNYPQMGRARPELSAVEGLNSFAIGKYVVFYQVVDDAVHISRVLHGSMDIPVVLRALQ
ncbi:MAG: type II toxin-antitoxin system RelE/ParE family toxin [Myxococcota bacterium]|nr:type II toxin-antitoxin system RelE/ParE family toxin [Myxococcota bacterium]